MSTQEWGRVYSLNASQETMIAAEIAKNRTAIEAIILSQPGLSEQCVSSLSTTINETLAELKMLLNVHSIDVAIANIAPNVLAHAKKYRLPNGTAWGIVVLGTDFLCQLDEQMLSTENPQLWKWRLQFVLAHEAKHIQQHGKFPTFLAKELQMFDGSLKTWHGMRNEFAANLFALNYLMGKPKQTPTDRLGANTILQQQFERLQTFSCAPHFLKRR
ncbi:MAG: hypothetical protein KGJ07_07210 [Patescibacteria group bacterium]|nr:hypothetical protein [Patescibacteria group bacterium]MDE2589018.1 hypothetical protein [Patescibacteria group bacterium]